MSEFDGLEIFGDAGDMIGGMERFSGFDVGQQFDGFWDQINPTSDFFKEFKTNQVLPVRAPNGDVMLGDTVNLTKFKTSFADVGGTEVKTTFTSTEFPDLEIPDASMDNIDAMFDALGIDTKDVDGFQELKERERASIQANPEQWVAKQAANISNDAGAGAFGSDTTDPGSQAGLDEQMKGKIDPAQYESIKQGFGEVNTSLKNMSDDEITKEIETQENLPPEKRSGVFKQITDWFGENKWKFLKYAFGVGVLVFLLKLADSLYDFIKNLGDAASGCWANSQNGSCKILELTCKGDDKVNQTMKSWSACQACSDTTKCGNNSWLPILKVSEACDNTKTYPGTFNSSGNCQTSCPAAGSTCPVNPNPICANATWSIPLPTCQSTDGDCSSICNTDSLTVPSGVTVQCKKVSWPGAIFNGLGNFFNNLGLGDIGKYIKYVIFAVLGIFALMFLIYVGKWIYHTIKGKKEGEEGNEDGGGEYGKYKPNTLNIKVSSK